MGLYQRGGWYYYRCVIDKKKYHKALKLRVGKHERLLSARIDQVEEEIRAEHFGIPHRKRRFISLKEYKKKYLRQKADKKTSDLDSQRLDFIIKALGNLDLDQIGRREIKKLEACLLEENRGKTTVNRYMALLRNFFNLAIEDGHVPNRVNPVKKYFTPWRERRTRRALTAEEIADVLHSAKGISERPRSVLQRTFYDLVLFGLATGARLSQILHLRHEHIREGIAWLPPETKGSKSRDRGGGPEKIPIYLSPLAQEVIRRQPTETGYVFSLPSRHTGIMTCSIERVRKETGLEGFDFHTLRHTFSSWVAQNADLPTAKNLLGHSQIRTTERYSHPIGHESSLRAVANIGNLIREKETESK